MLLGDSSCREVHQQQQQQAASTGVPPSRSIWAGLLQSPTAMLHILGVQVRSTLCHVFCVHSVDVLPHDICSHHTWLCKLNNKANIAQRFAFLQHTSSVMRLQNSAWSRLAMLFLVIAKSSSCMCMDSKPALRIWAHVSAGRVHSKTRAGVAALAARHAHDLQALPAGDDTIKQQQRQQQQHWVSALPKQTISDCSTAFSALRHAHAGTKRCQEAASLPTADPLHTPFKSCRVGSLLPSSPPQMGICRQQHALIRQVTGAAQGPALGRDASPSISTCQTPAADFLSPCMNGLREDQPGNSCQLQTANCQQSCRAGLHVHMHRQSNRDSACHRADTEADASRTNSGSSGSTTLLACVKSEPKSEEDTHYQTGLLLTGPEHVQQLDSRRQSAHPQTSETAAASCQQHQLHMIDLMLARVSAAEEAIHLGLAQPHQSDLCFRSHHDPWAPLNGCNKLLREKESGTRGETEFSGMESLLLGGSQQAECNLGQLAVMDDIKSNHKDKILMKAPDDTLEGCTERTHSSSGSSIDCPGRFLVPKDWFLDGSDEVDLDCFSTVSNDGSMLGLALLLMPPSLLQFQE